MRSNQFTGTIAVPFFGEYQTQVVLASTGFAIFGVGSEICGVTVTKILAKWFTGHEMALAMGVQVALARLGTAAALSASLVRSIALSDIAGVIPVKWNHSAPSNILSKSN